MEIKVENYNDYTKALDGRGDVIVFRGQLNSSFVLIPSGLRPEHSADADKKMFAFVKEMKTLFGFDELTCIEIAQHFSLPTRMLDFSYSYDVALFFACYDSRNKYTDKDGKVYIFNKSKYERLIADHNKKSSQIIRNNRYLYSWLSHYIDKKEKDIQGAEVDMPIFVDATRSFDRLSQQKGLFLLWGSDENCLEDILAHEGIAFSEIVDTITIKSEAKQNILKELAKRKLSEDTLYMNVNRIKELVSEIKGK